MTDLGTGEASLPPVPVSPYTPSEQLMCSVRNSVEHLVFLQMPLLFINQDKRLDYITAGVLDKWDRQYTLPYWGYPATAFSLGSRTYDPICKITLLLGKSISPKSLQNTPVSTQPVRQYWEEEPEKWPPFLLQKGARRNYLFRSCCHLGFPPPFLAISDSLLVNAGPHVVSSTTKIRCSKLIHFHRVWRRSQLGSKAAI